MTLCQKEDALGEMKTVKKYLNDFSNYTNERMARQ